MDRRTPDDPSSPASGFPRLSDLEGREYDALADLFLGDAGLAPKPATVGPNAPVRPDPQVGVSSALEGSVARRVEAETVPSERVIEAVLLGHLPVRASVWVRQYASSLATNLGRPVGLLRVSTDSTSVELVGAGVDDLALGGLPQSADASEALERAAGLADRWLVRVDETAEPGLAETEGVDEVTILTGADEAAIVASYRLVKSLASSWDRVFGEDAGPGLSLAIMGSGGEQALAATEKLERAAEAFLNRPIAITARIPKIGVATAATVFRGAGSVGAEELVSVLREERGATLRLADVGWSPDDADERAETEGAHRPDDEMQQIEFEPDTQGVEGVIEPPRGDIPARPVIETRRVADVTPKKISPKPEAAAEAPRPEAREAKTGRVSAASLIEGLTALETACPYAGGVEFAADPDGQLHLLARDEAEGAIEAFRDLTAAAAWARVHYALILRAEPLLAHPTSDHRVSGDPVLHVIASDARAARPILDADVHVHLLTPVTLGGQSGWVTCELN